MDSSNAFARNLSILLVASIDFVPNFDISAAAFATSSVSDM